LRDELLAPSAEETPPCDSCMRFEANRQKCHQQSFRAEADLRAEARASGAAPSTAIEHV